MSKRASQPSPTSHRSFKKQKTAPPSPPLVLHSPHPASPTNTAPMLATPFYLQKNHPGLVTSPFGLASPIQLPIRPTLPTPNSSTDGTQWTRAEKRRHKKQKKDEQKSLTQPASFAFNTEDLQKRDAVTIADIRELTLHLTGDASPPTWLRVTNRNAIKRTVVLLVPGITKDTFVPPLRQKEGNPLYHVPTVQSGAHLPFLSTFLNAVPTRAPGDVNRMHSIIQGYFMGPVTGEEKKRRILSRIQDARQSLPSLSHYVLSVEQMMENEYPIPKSMAETTVIPDDWLQTPPYVPADGDKGRVLALDCEMCITESGKELTRVCIIDFETNEKLYDQLVKPVAQITDYLTRFSGITAEKLEGVTTRLIPDVHNALKELIQPSTILVGHSLESDLRALQLVHGRCIDTSVIYSHPRGRPLKPGLAWLTKKWVGRDIQTAGEGGHDPEEDARACIDLLKLKIKNGPGFGDFIVDTESILERMARKHGSGRREFRTGVVDYGSPATWLGAKATSTVACKSDEEVRNGIVELIANHDFVFGRMMGLSESLGWTTKLSGVSPTTSTSSPTLSPSKPLAEVYESLNSQLSNIYKSLPPATAFILFTGHDDPRRMSELAKAKNRWEQLLREGKSPEDIPREEWWTTQEARLLEDEVEKAKQGLLFIGLKH